MSNSNSNQLNKNIPKLVEIKSNFSKILIFELSDFFTLCDLKKEIKKRTSIPAKNQILKFENRLLKDHFIFTDKCYHKNMISFYLSVRFTSLNVHYLQNNSLFKVNADPNSKISQIKEEILKITKIPLDNQKLLYAGHQLDENKILSDYDVAHNSTLMLINLDEKISLKIYFDDLEILVLDVKQSTTIQEVQDHFYNQFSMTVKLFHKKRLLCESETCLKAGLKDGCNLKAVPDFPKSTKEHTSKGITKREATTLISEDSFEFDSSNFYSFSREVEEEFDSNNLPLSSCELISS